jgi:TRAP-type C4-dicarboxylate transport system substrate-binding protein
MHNPRNDGTSLNGPLRRYLLPGLAGLGTLVLLAASLTFSQQFTIKFATLAPEGSTWMKVMKEFDQSIRKESGGRLGFKIYGGGVQGDEKDVLRKIKLGQLHSAGITGNGMTSIAKNVRILDSPFLFRSYDEVDQAYQAFDKEFKQAFEDNGYVNLGWAEVGFIYVFTNTPVTTPADMKGVKMWIWEGDPIAEAAFKAMNVSPIPLSITDVLTSLQTNLIDGVYISPYAAIALQWFTRVKYMLDLPLADASGAVVVSKKKFDELSPDLQEILLRNGKKYMQELTRLSRQENSKAIVTLKENGVTLVEPSSAQAIESYDEIGRKTRRMLVGKLFPEELLNRLEQTVAKYRSANSPKK